MRFFPFPNHEDLLSDGFLKAAQLAWGGAPDTGQKIRDWLDELDLDQEKIPGLSFLAPKLLAGIKGSETRAEREGLLAGLVKHQMVTNLARASQLDLISRSLLGSSKSLVIAGGWADHRSGAVALADASLNLTRIAVHPFTDTEVSSVLKSLGWSKKGRHWKRSVDRAGNTKAELFIVVSDHLPVYSKTRSIEPFDVSGVRFIDGVDAILSAACDVSHKPARRLFGRTALDRLDTLLRVHGDRVLGEVDARAKTLKLSAELSLARKLRSTILSQGDPLGFERPLADRKV